MHPCICLVHIESVLCRDSIPFSEDPFSEFHCTYAYIYALYLCAGAVALSLAYFGRGTGNIWLDNVWCSGTESRLIECPANLVGVHNCGHNEDASVHCSVRGECRATLQQHVKQ